MFGSPQKFIQNLQKSLGHFQKSWSWQGENLMHLTQKIVGRYFNETCSLWSIKVIVTAAVKKISCLRDQTGQKPVIFVIFAFIFKLKLSPAVLITIISFFLSFFWLSLVRLATHIWCGLFNCPVLPVCMVTAAITGLWLVLVLQIISLSLPEYYDPVSEDGSNKILWCDHSNKNFWAVFSCCTVCYAGVQDGSHFSVWGWNSAVWPFKWNIFSSTFLRYWLLCCTKWF